MSNCLAVFIQRDNKFGTDIMEKNSTKDRIQWIDCAKGLAICLVILGHTVRRGEPVSEDIVRGLIFSFHMPLFFLLSGMTFKMSNDGEKLIRRAEKSFKRLIIPAVSVFLLLRVYNAILYGISGGMRAFLAETINVLIYSSGVGVQPFNIPAMGKLWFLIALFSSRIIFDYLHLKLTSAQLVLTCIMLAFIGIGFGKIQWLPFSLDISLAVMPFMLLGYEYMRSNIIKSSFLALTASGFIWILSFIFVFHYSRHYLELATREYPLTIVSYIGAIAGSAFICMICMYLEKARLYKPLSYLGRISMEIYLVHAADGVFVSIWNNTFIHNTYVMAFVRVVIDVMIAIIIVEGRRYISNSIR